MNVSWLIVHGIVNISALVIKKLSKWNHCSIFEILSETSRDEMGLNPLDIIYIDRSRLKKLRIFCANLNKLLTLLLELFPLLGDS